MTTPDGQGVKLPAEAQQAATSPAALGAGATPPAPSPGVGLAATRVPSGPTLPDLDPATLTLVVSRVAGELFAAPAGTTAAPVPATSASASAPATPPGGAALPATHAPAEAPSPPAATAPAHPFFVEPRLDALLTPAGLEPDIGEVMRLPLVDDGEPPPPPAPPPGVPTPDVPAPSRTDVAAPAAALPTSNLYEVRPEVDLHLPPARGGFDAYALRKEFPILEERIHGKRLVWLDNAATTQKPLAVIERLRTFYTRENSNIHRAAHTLAARATDAYEGARESVRRFVNAASVRDVVFVRGATEGINLVAQSWGRRHVGAGDEIVVTHLEHHANIVPWQMLCAEVGARLRVAPVDDTGQIILDAYDRLLTDRTKLVALPQVSNALGTVTPAAQMIELAHRRGAKVLLDGAQSVSHMRVDVQRLGCDFFVFSGHKVFAPTGIGAVVAPAALLDDTPPWQGGGNMIQDVTFERTVYQPAPARFEAGTGSIGDAVALGAALDWLSRVGLENVERHEHDLLVYGTEQLRTVPGLTIIGTAAEKAGVLSFVIAGHDTHAIGSFLDREGIAVRGGHHCAQPILRRFGLESTVRASLAPYNTVEDLDALVAALCRLQGGRR